MVNQAHVDEWLADLDTTDAPQVQGRLAEQRLNGKIGYCCIGRGCEVAGIERKERGSASGGIVLIYGKEANGSTAPAELLEWLGLGAYADTALQIDWPRGERTLYGPPSYDEDGYPNPVVIIDYHCAALNDEGFTFRQIADLIRYFGLRERTDG